MIYIIYKISIANQCYIGSTKDLKQRKKCHKDRWNKGTEKIYEFIRANGGWDKIEIIPIEEYECEGLLQARIREEYWRREYNAELNTRRAFTTHNDVLEDKKRFYNENKDKILKKMKEQYHQII